MTAPIAPEQYAEYVASLTQTERIAQLKKYQVIRRSGSWRDIPPEHKELMSANAETLQAAINMYLPTT